jgi:chromosome partitioning protein
MIAKVITIAQQKGGAGKTTVAAHIAIALHQKNYKVLLVDIDPQASLTTWYNVRKENQKEDINDVDLISVAGWRVENEITKSKDIYDFIVIDSPPHTEAEAKSAIRSADMIITPIQASPTDIWATHATTQLAEKEKKPLYLLLNRLSPNSKITSEITKGLKNLLKTTLGNRVAFATCLLEGKCVTETNPGSAAAKEVKSLAEEVLKLLKNVSNKKQVKKLEAVYA